MQNKAGVICLCCVYLPKHCHKGVKFYGIGKKIDAFARYMRYFALPLNHNREI